MTNEQKTKREELVKVYILKIIKEMNELNDNVISEKELESFASFHAYYCVKFKRGMEEIKKTTMDLFASEINCELLRGEDYEPSFRFSVFPY